MRSIALLAVLAAPASAQTAEWVLTLDEPLNGLTGTTAAAIGDVAVNRDGGWITRVVLDDGVTQTEAIYGSLDGGTPVVLRTAGPLGDYEQTAISRLALADDGRIAYSATSTDLVGGSTTVYGVWIDDAPFALRGTLTPDVPNQQWLLGHPLGFTTGGEPVIDMWYTVAGNPGSTPTGDGAFLGDPALTVYRSNESYPGLEFPLLANPFEDDSVQEVGFSADGSQNAAILVTKGPKNSNGYVVRDGEVVVVEGRALRENTLLPASMQEAPNERWNGFQSIGVANGGSYAISASTKNGLGSSSDHVLVLDGELLWREGDTIDGEVLVANTRGFGRNAPGDLAFVWGIEDAGSFVTQYGVFFNGRKILRSGDNVDLDGDGEADPGSVVNDFLVGTALGQFELSDDRVLFAGLRLDAEGGTPGPAGSSVVRMQIRDLEADADEASLSAGGSVGFTLFAPRDVGAELYWVNASATGTSPGIDLGNGLVMPLNFDPLYALTLKAANGAVFSNTLGVLDELHTARASFDVPAGADPGLAGVLLHFAYATFDAATTIRSVSNAVPVTLVP